MHQRPGEHVGTHQELPRPLSVKNEGEFTLAMLRDHLREFKMRPYGGDLRGVVNQSVPADNTWLSATRKRDGSINLSDPDAPIVISFRAIHRELRYFTMDASWESNNSHRLFNAALDEWQRLVMHLGHAWRCYNHLEDDEGNPVTPSTLETTIEVEQWTKLNRERAAVVNHFTCILALSPMIAKCKTKLKTYRPFSNKARENLGKLLEYENRVQTSLMLTPVIMENHGYNVINVEEGNHEEIMKRNRCFSALREFMTTLTETQAGGGQPGAQVAAGNWKKVLKLGDGQWPPEPPMVKCLVG